MDGIVRSNLADILQESVSADDVSFIVHHPLILAKDLNCRADGRNEEISAADAFLPEPFQFSIQVLFQLLLHVIVKAGGFWTFVDKETEIKALKENQSFIQAETGLTVNVQDGDKPTNDPDARAPKALPGRPALYLE